MFATRSFDQGTVLIIRAVKTTISIASIEVHVQQIFTFRLPLLHFYYFSRLHLGVMLPENLENKILNLLKIVVLQCIS